MFSIIKRFNRQITTVKKFRPLVYKKHKYDIENESWTEPKKQNDYVYKLIRIKKKVSDKQSKNIKEK